MKRVLFFLFIFGGVATSASAQGGWDAPSGWDTPKKSTPKKTTKTTSSKATQNAGAAAAPVAAPEPAPEAAPAPAAAADKGFGGGSGNSSSSSATYGQSISIAPGTPVMLQSGRNIMADEAAAARERRANRKIRSKPWPPRPMATTEAAPAPAPVAMPEPVPTPPAPTGAEMSASTAKGGSQAAPKKTVSKPAKAVKKAAPSSDGW